MKKLMILAVAVCAAVAAQAVGSFQWSQSGIFDADGWSTYWGSATIYAVPVNGGSKTALGDYYVMDGSVNVNISAYFLETGKEYDLYIEMKSTLMGCVYVYTDNTKITASDDTSIPLDFGYSQNLWAKNIPEPTSGVLMLVGLAGLALKRRRV